MKKYKVVRECPSSVKLEMSRIIHDGRRNWQEVQQLNNLQCNNINNSLTWQQIGEKDNNLEQFTSKVMQRNESYDGQRLEIARKCHENKNYEKTRVLKRQIDYF